MKIIQTFISASLLPLGGFASPGFADDITIDLKPHIVVDQGLDSLDGVCGRDVARQGLCNLRAAVAEALKQDGSVIDVLVDSEITQGHIVISASAKALHPLRIQGRGEGQRRIVGNGLSRLFDITETSSVQLSGLYITQFRSFEAGAIVNRGSLDIENSSFFANRVACFGSGAMTAYATCGAGAISNGGLITLNNGSLFEKNEVVATASTASFTNASGSGGAISSGGTILLDGEVVFESNSVTSEAFSGIHPMPAGGADAKAWGGAIYSFNGTIEVMDTGFGKCRFSNNVAQADASTPFGTASLTSQGGAVYASGGTIQLLTQACVFEGNQAAEDVDFAFVPPEAIGR